MKLLTRRTAPEDELEVDAPAGGKKETSTEAVEWTGPAAWITKSITGLLLTCLVAGPIGLGVAGWVLWSTATTTPPAPVVSSEAGDVDERTAVEAFASDFVVTWLTTTNGQEKRLAPFLPNYSSIALPETPWLVWDATPAGIVSSEGSWSVTVAATVAEAKNAPAVRRYFQVPVVYDRGALAAQALPAPVAAPAQAATPKLAYRYRAGLDDPVSSAAGEFLTALLVGGDVTRVISPDATIRAVVPAPYALVTVEDVQVDEDLTGLTSPPEDSQQLHLLVTATAVPATQTNALTVQYALTLTARAGRWEVSAIDATPASSPDQPSQRPAPGTAPAAPEQGSTSEPVTRSPTESAAP